MHCIDPHEHKRYNPPGIAFPLPCITIACIHAMVHQFAGRVERGGIPGSHEPFSTVLLKQKVKCYADCIKDIKWFFWLT